MGEDDFVIAPDRRSRRWLVVAGAVALVLLLAWGAWGLAHRRAADQVASVTPPTIEPAQPTTPSVVPDTTATTPATSTPEPGEATQTAEPGANGTSSVAPATHPRAPYIVFRLNGTLYLARENGIRAIPLVKTGGVYSLSPDARSLAFVDNATRNLVVLDLAKETTLTVGPARQVTPEWSPDSSWLLAVRDAGGETGTEIFRVDRATGQAVALGAGLRGAISPDGSVVALVPGLAADKNNVLVLLRSGRLFKELKAPAPILDAVLADNGAFVCTASSGGNVNAQGVWFLGLDGRNRLVSRAPGGGSGVLGSLAMSPNGAYLAYELAGDDGYSRMSITKTSGGVPVLVSQRRDVYPMWWTSDSSAIFAIEGNSWQGERTALVRIAPDGHRESTVVQGADR